MRVLKGHGTGNDFVVLPDLDGRIDVTPALVAALCDRRRGIGGDGILRVLSAAASPDPAEADFDYFMDYRNSDGSIAEMCGNGARVFAEYLVRAGLQAPGEFRIGTRGGTRAATASGNGQVRVTMGAVAAVPAAATGGIEVRVGDRTWPAVPVFVPNPHAVAFVEDVDHAGALLQPPQVDPAEAYPAGVNVEFVQELGPDHARMRVFERGSGETLSCGTGACAVAWALWQRQGGTGPRSAVVDVPGGRLVIDVDSLGELGLSGPVEFVGEIDLDPGWLAARVPA